MTQYPTVLYVEDDESDRFFMSNAFAVAGLSSVLQTVSDGSAAIDYLSGTGPYADRWRYPLPQLVLLDLNLPNISGFKVLEWIRSQATYADLPVVIFSSSPYEEDEVRSMALGATDYWAKPKSGLQYRNVVASLREQWLLPPGAPPDAAGQQVRL